MVCACGIPFFGCARPVNPIVELARGVLRCLSCVTLGYELIEAGDLAVGDLAEDPCEPGLRIDVVQFGGFNQGIGDGHGFAATF